MSAAAPAAIYAIDTSSLMDWHARFYPEDVFPALARAVEALAASGRLQAPALVREELEAVGTDALRRWVAARSGFFVPNVVVLVGARTIQDHFPGLLDSRAQHEEADAYVIALAQRCNGIVVTQETPAAEKHRPRRSHFIPDVCRELGIPCISFLGLTRREGWRF